MTEDDTFRVLSRPPFGEVRRRVRALNKSGRGGRVGAVLVRIGWTVSEYNRELARVVNDRG